MTTTVRPLTPKDAEAFRAIRLESLLAHPTAFGMGYEDEADLGIETFAARLSEPLPSSAFGGFDGEELVAIARLRVAPNVKQRHRGTIVGVYVRPAFRRSGLSHRLIDSIIQHARQHELETLLLTVAVGNHAARALYVGRGFIGYGVDKGALKLHGTYVDEELMALSLKAAAVS